MIGVAHLLKLFYSLTILDSEKGYGPHLVSVKYFTNTSFVDILCVFFCLVFAMLL